VDLRGGRVAAGLVLPQHQQARGSRGLVLRGAIQSFQAISCFCAHPFCGGDPYNQLALGRVQHPQRYHLSAVGLPVEILFNVGHPERQAVKDWTLRPLTFQAHLERVVLHQIHEYQSLFVQALAVTTFEWAKEPAHCSAILSLEERRNLWQFRVGDWSMAWRGTTVNLLHAGPDPKGMLDFLAQHRVPVVYEWRDKWQLNPSLRVFNPDQHRFASQYAVDRAYRCELEVAQFPDVPKVSKRALTCRDSKDS
jgi:hypothetical protein